MHFNGILQIGALERYTCLCHHESEQQTNKRNSLVLLTSALEYKPATSGHK